MSIINKFLDLQESLVSLGFQDGELEQDPKAKIQLILKSCSKLLKVARVSLWKFSDNRQAIICESLYARNEDSFSSGIILEESDYPHYFSSLNCCRIINADNANTDERTKEFENSYLKPLNIMSLLDVPILHKGSLYGIICIEQVATYRQWDMAEISYAVTVADTISLIISQSSWFKEKQRMRYLERIDPLTNLENRLFFQSRIDQFAKSAIEITRCAVILVGLDGFTCINDRFGYSFANKLLCEISHRLENIESNLPFYLARVGGDVFALWLPEHDDEAFITTFIAHIQSAFDQAIKTPTSDMIHVSACLGVFTSSLEEVDGLDPIRKAEIAMLKAKEQGAGKLCFYNPEWLAQHKETKKFEAEFIDALTNGQIVPFYQPIVKASYQKEGLSLEALVRWKHPKKGVLTPFVILPLAKRLGLMKELGDVVLEAVCNDLHQFKKQAVNIKRVSVNISSEQLFSVNLIEQIKASVTRHNIAFTSLEFEIVEELIAGDSQILNERLEDLTQLGIQLSIDDFGTGYSSLSRLKDLKVSKLKIDKSFVEGLPENEHDTCIVKSVIGLAKGMKLKLVAEGVETKKQATWLLEHQCEFLQGYLFSKPIQAHEVKKFMSNKITDDIF